MKLKNVNDFEDKIIGAESEQMFTIDTDNHVIFDILRNKMYSDPIAAICREVASNSRDANRESGKGHIPIKISIYKPNQLLFISDMSISFEDNGPGIDPRRMGDIFLKYGASTKRDTNSQTGGFGLGAKTPFAYSDTFTIITICEIPTIYEEIQGDPIETKSIEVKRMKYTYTAMIDSSGKGKMVLMGSEQTSEELGTKVIVPINDQDRDQFEKECIMSTLFWEIKPKFENFRTMIPKMEKVFSQETDGIEDWCVIYDRLNYLGQGRHWVALVDGIAYYLDSNKVKTKRNLDTDHIILMHFDNGDLTISANREQLQYDEETIETINSQLDIVKLHYVEFLKKYYKEADTYIEACIRGKALGNGINKYNSNYDKLLKNLSPQDLLIRSMYSWLRNEDIIEKIPKKWKERKLAQSIDVPNITIELVSRAESGKFLYEKTTSIDDYWNEYPVIYKDIKTKDNKRNSTLLKDHKKFLMISVENNNITEIQANKQLDFVMNWGINFIDYSSIERDETPNPHLANSNQYKKQPYVDIDCFIYNQSTNTDDYCEQKGYVRFDRKTEEFENYKDIIYGCVDSLNAKNYDNYRYLRKRAKVVALLLNKEVVIMNNRSAELYGKKSKAMSLKLAINIIETDLKHSQKLQDILHVTEAIGILNHVDYKIKSIIKIEHPKEKDLEKIIRENKKFEQLTVTKHLFNIKNQPLNICHKDITDFYNKWIGENEVIYDYMPPRWCIERTLKDPKAKDYQKDYSKICQIREMYRISQIFKKAGPNLRIAETRIKQGLELLSKRKK